MRNKKYIQNEKNMKNFRLHINGFVENKLNIKKKQKFFRKHRFINVYLMLCVPAYIITIFVCSIILETNDLYYSLYVSILIFVLVYETIKYSMMKNKKITIDQIISEIKKQKPYADFGFETDDFLVYSTELVINDEDVIVEFTTPKIYNGTILLDEERMNVWKDYITKTY